MKKKNWTPYILIAVMAAGGFVLYSKISQDSGKSSATISEITVPKLSVIGAEGRDLFNVNCSACHGEDGKGSEVGPPLIHDIYNPGHHADVAFYLAVANGVRQHHWPYGSMPPLTDVSKDQAQKIIQYVRETQEANGIIYKAHNM